MNEKTQRRLAAIVSADVVGYSRLMGIDETGTHTRLKARFSELVMPLINEHDGRVVKLMGDGLLAEFPSVINAVKWAVDVQINAAKYDTEGASNDRIEYRVGVNLGDIIVDGDDIFGDGVNVAARLQELAQSGGIAISGNVQEQVRDKLEHNFTDDGEHEVKNIARPVHVWRWSPDEPSLTLTAISKSNKLSSPDKPSIVVLPFDNMSNDPDQEYFADGIVEGLTAALSRVKSFFMIARNSAFVFKGRSAASKEIRDILGVEYFLEGSIQKAGNRVRITVQLITTENGAHIWAGKFDGDLSDIFDLQDRVIQRVVGELEPNIRKAEIERSWQKRPLDLGAYDLVMRALPDVWALNKAANANALNILKKALEIDPDYAYALSLAAWCHGQQAVYNWGNDLNTARKEALGLAKRAISLSPDDPMNLTMLGTAYAISNDQKSARTFLERAVSLDPNSAWGWSRLGWTKVYLDHADEAILHFETALSLSPIDPMNFNNYAGLGSAHQLNSDYEKCIEAFEQALNENPEAIWIYRQLAPAYLEVGDRQNARDGVDKLLGMYPDLTVTKVNNAMVLPERGMKWICERLTNIGLPE